MVLSVALTMGTCWKEGLDEVSTTSHTQHATHCKVKTKYMVETLRKKKEVMFLDFKLFFNINSLKQT